MLRIPRSTEESIYLKNRGEMFMPSNEKQQLLDEIETLLFNAHQENDTQLILVKMFYLLKQLI